MCRQHDMFPKSKNHCEWNPSVFVETLKDVAPTIKWKDVCIGFDHSEFEIQHWRALELLIKIVEMGMGSFPADVIYRSWDNPKGQLMLITTILKYPKVYSFANHIVTPVSVELLETPSKEYSEEIATWKSLDLVDVLLTIAERELFEDVLELLEIPMQRYSDIIFMALVQSRSKNHSWRKVFLKLMPTILIHPNSNAMLTYAWNLNKVVIHHAIFNSIVKWYLDDGDMNSIMKWCLDGGNNVRLNRILDIAEDLTPSLLDVQSSQFVIGFACLAMQHEHLNFDFDKWLDGQIRKHGEFFIRSIVTFLQRQCPESCTVSIPNNQMRQTAQIPLNITQKLLDCLRSAQSPKISLFSSDLREMIGQMLSTCL